MYKTTWGCTMSYTNITGNPEGQPLNLPGFLRQALIAEIIAINGYRKHMAMSPIKELNDIWYHIMEEEKKHYGMFLELLRKYDPCQEKAYREVKDEIKIMNPKLPPCRLERKDCYLNLVRKDIKGELEAVLLYDQNLAFIEETDVRQVYDFVIQEERHHLEELTAAMIQYDHQSYGPITD